MVEIHEVQQARDLDIIFGKLQLSGGRGGFTLTYGWDTAGYPMATTDRRRITQAGRDSIEGLEVAPFPYEAEQANYTPVVSEFAEFAKPVDRPDRGRQFTEDTVNIAVTDEIGSVKFIKVKELTLLDAIIKGQVELGSGGNTLYSVIVPDTETEALNIILFSPGNEATNEFAYRNFLLKTIKILAEIDRNQNPPDQKGYMEVVEGIIEDLKSKGFGDPGGNTKILNRLGILGQVNDGQRMAYLNVDQLRYVVDEAQKKVTESFALGK